MKKINLKSDPYLLINLFFAGVILLIFMYSGIFSAQKCNYPIHSNFPSFASENSLMQNPSEGLSRAFSEIVRGRFKEALLYNKESVRIFAFFFSQLILRIVFAVILIYSKNLLLYKTRKRLVIFDGGLSVILYILAFYNYFIAF